MSDRSDKKLDSRLRGNDKACGNDKNKPPRHGRREFNKMPPAQVRGLNNKRIPHAAFGGFGMTHRVAQGAEGIDSAGGGQVLFIEY